MESPPDRTDISDNDRPTLSVVIPTYNGRRLLEACLASVARHRPPDAEVVVVDDCSTDGTAEWLCAAFPTVRLVRLVRNHGFCGAINAGIRAATGRIVETLNNDTLVTARWAEAAMRHFTDPTVGSVAPLVLRWPDSERVDSAGDLYHVSGWAFGRGHGETAGEDLTRPTEVFGASASAGFFRRDALLRVGGFPEHFGAYFDDVDLAFRLRWAGYRCVYEPGACVYHRANCSHDHASPAHVRQAALNEERVFWANLPGPWLRRALVPHALLLAATFVSRCMQGRGAPYLAGKLAAVAEWRELARRRAANAALAGDAAAPDFPCECSLDWIVRRAVRRLRCAWSRRAMHAVAAAQPAGSI